MSEQKKRWEMTIDGPQWNIDPIYIDAEERYSLEMETTTQTPCISFPVWNGMAEYAEYYWLEDEEYQRFLHDHDAMLVFVNRCKRREMDDRLMYQPGSSRGWAN